MHTLISAYIFYDRTFTGVKIMHEKYISIPKYGHHRLKFGGFLLLQYSIWHKKVHFGRRYFFSSLQHEPVQVSPEDSLLHRRKNVLGNHYYYYWESVLICLKMCEIPVCSWCPRPWWSGGRMAPRSPSSSTRTGAIWTLSRRPTRISQVFFIKFIFKNSKLPGSMDLLRSPRRSSSPPQSLQTRRGSGRRWTHACALPCLFLEKKICLNF